MLASSEAPSIIEFRQGRRLAKGVQSAWMKHDSEHGTATREGSQVTCHTGVLNKGLNL